MEIVKFKKLLKMLINKSNKIDEKKKQIKNVWTNNKNNNK